MTVELRRTASVVEATAELVFEHGLYVWDQTKDWSGPEKVNLKGRATISTVHRYAGTKAVRLDEYYQNMLVSSWQACALLAETISNILKWPEPSRDALNALENQLLKGRRPDRKIVGQVNAVLNGTYNNLIMDDTLYAYACNSNHMNKASLLVFEHVSELRGFILDSTRWRTATVTDKKEARKRVSDLCIEPYCRDIVPIPRKGRCPSCYAWIRKNKEKYVPYDVILARLERKKK